MALPFAWVGLPGQHVLILKDQHLNQNWHKLPIEFAFAKNNIMMVAKTIENAHIMMQQYKPVLPKAKCSSYEALIILFDCLANLASLEHHLVYVSKWIEKGDDLGEENHWPYYNSESPF